ncbi:4325_t:CDS:2 [Acaulospora colombiana]|uniref:4325_t:CDS:1 n=1 Tax=Acaulospora colombiana TaxID=27376 RepID=A0ACA9LPH0_9GLOM|nr:4325_t:CDS:2 [Acaulospora colombiana]
MDTFFNSRDSTVNRGVKRPVGNGALSQQRPFQRQRTLEYDNSVNCVSNQVNDLTLVDNDMMDLSESSETNTTTTPLDCTNEILSQAAVVVDVVASFVPFGGLISSICKAGEEIISLYQKAEHNRGICSHMTQRVIAAMAAVRDLKTRKNENEKFFTKENLQIFEGFVDCMWRIRDYIVEISQLGRMRMIFQGNMIEQRFDELTTEFEGYMKSLQFSIIVQSNLGTNTELQIISQNVKELKENQQRIRNPDTPELVNIGLLDLNLYERIIPNVTRRNVTKRLSKLHGDEVAFKEFTNNSEETGREICQQVAILRYLKDSGHIIKFYGIANDGIKYYLVTEWMENRSLLEYYECHPFISWTKKLDFAVDICRGLIFLNAVEILHRDLRGANMLVDKNHKVKIANFGLSRKFTEITRNIQTSLVTVRYMAPEKLSKGEKHAYDVKCEIYSLGALLWEIAEQRMPFSTKKLEFQVIRDLVVKSRYREPLSPGVPEAWKMVVNKALHYSPLDRPAIANIFENLYQCQRTFNPQPQPIKVVGTGVDDGFGSENEILDIDEAPMDESAFMSVQEAIKEHKKGNKQAAWKCFCHHAENGDMHAKFWVGCYLYYSEIDDLKHDREGNLVRAAQLFKETADNGRTEAQLKYGGCLWSGKGVKTNYNEAIRYLTMAADNGNADAMYNVGCAYYNGKGVLMNRERGVHYLKEAARREHPKSIEKCKNINVDYLY